MFQTDAHTKPNVTLMKKKPITKATQHSEVGQMHKRQQQQQTKNKERGKAKNNEI